MCKSAYVGKPSLKNLVRFIAMILLVFVTGCGGQKALTVAKVIQNVERLDGKTIRVRGLANLWVDPSRGEMWMYGGCALKTDPNTRQGYVRGWLTLYDSIESEGLWAYGGPQDQTGVKISESSFDCEGDYCKITCSPFEVVSQRMYEFTGTLQVNENSEYILENIDLEQSRQLVDGKWVPIQKGNFDVSFP